MRFVVSLVIVAKATTAVVVAIINLVFLIIVGVVVW